METPLAIVIARWLFLCASIIPLIDISAMTAEAAILNRSAVALAADSLVTVTGYEDTSPKTYEVNKLFTLSKYRPVGIMVYGNAELLGVPWAPQKHIDKLSLSAQNQPPKGASKPATY